MNAWLVAALVLLPGLAPFMVVALRERIADAVVALEAAGVLATVEMLLLAEGFHREALVDLAVVLAVMSFIGGLAYVRFIEREGRRS